MKTIIKLFIAPLFAASFCCAQTTELVVGNRPLTINNPPGYVSACDKSEELRGLFASSLPPTHSMVACFLEKKEFELYPEVDPNIDNPYLHIQALKALNGRDLTQPEFDAFRATIVAQQDSMFANLSPKLKDILDNASAEASEVLASDVSVDIEGIIPLGVFSDTENNIGFGLIRNSKISTVEGDITVSEAIASNMVLIDGRLLILHGAKARLGESDYEQVKNLILQWGENIKVKGQ